MCSRKETAITLCSNKLTKLFSATLYFITSHRFTSEFAPKRIKNRQPLAYVRKALVGHLKYELQYKNFFFV